MNKKTIRLGIAGGLTALKKVSIRGVPTLDGRTYKTQMSFPWAKVAAATLTSATPTIAGTVKAGNVLTVKRGTWTLGYCLQVPLAPQRRPDLRGLVFDVQGPDRR